MKKGFTMIELIFVIVILGILAAVAIPRLSATRDDATVTAAAADVATLYKDLAGYYTAQGTWAGDANNTTGNSALTTVNLRLMSNIATATAANGIISFSTNNGVCFTVQLDRNGTIGAVTAADTNNSANDTVCSQVMLLPSINNLLSNQQSFGGQRVAR